MANYYIGTSGWVYRHWKGVFYPEEISQKNWLSFYSKNFNSCEVNSTFYRQATKKTLDSWQKETPADFCFAIKLNKFATHFKKMDIARDELAEMINPHLALGSKMGPILIQLPPFLVADIELLASFIKRLPKDFRYAFEPRHDTWFSHSVYRVLKENNVALVTADSGKDAFKITKTADFAYIRLHGNSKHDHFYPKKEINLVAEEIKAISKDFKEIFVYFNNDIHGYAVQNARDLKGILETKIGKNCGIS